MKKMGVIPKHIGNSYNKSSEYFKVKKSTKRKNFNKFTKRNTHKRKSKTAAISQILSTLERDMGVRCEGARVSVSEDLGRRARVSARAGRDEIALRGVFSSSKSGFGFVSADGLERDIFIPEDKTMGAIDGDVVEIVYHEYKSRFGEKKTEGRVKKIVEYGRKTVIGTLVSAGGYYSARKRGLPRLTVEADDGKFNIYPLVTDTMGAQVGDKVEVLLERNSGGCTTCAVVRSFGDAESREANYEAILAECDITVDFTSEELMEAEFFAQIPLNDEGRTRREHEVIFTIDGEGAKDLDDAISLRRLSDGWQLSVHIADVSYYVKERSHLDRAVMSRATSVYFTDKVVPMLPPSLSNGACSLNAGEEKYALSAIINLSSDGEIKKTKIEKSIIKSRVRGVYSEVNAIFENRADKGLLEKYKEVIPTLKKMHELYLVLKKKSEARGALELESNEAEILLDASGVPTDILKRERGDAEKLIEQFMLTANEAVATLLLSQGIPCVYRVHENPPQDRLSEFVTFAQNLGFDTREISKEGAASSAFCKLLNEARERGISTPVSYSLLRSMAKAKYSELPSTHFGLGIERYCHFTSPIRRLSDLATHRIIHRVLFEGKKKENYIGYARRAAAAATEGELRALAAERRIENLYKVIYMESFIGEKFDATVSSVTSFGIFAELDNTCEGLVPISMMPGMFVFDEKNLTVRSRDIVYRIGDRIRVRLEEADMIRGKLRFSVAEEVDF